MGAGQNSAPDRKARATGGVCFPEEWQGWPERRRSCRGLRQSSVAKAIDSGLGDSTLGGRGPALHILHVVGARPNLMKVAPVLRALRPHPKIKQTLIHTG